MKLIQQKKSRGLRSLIDSFKPLPLRIASVSKPAMTTQSIFVSPNVSQIKSGSVSAEGNTSLFAGRVTTIEGMKRSIEMAESYVF